MHTIIWGGAIIKIIYIYTYETDSYCYIPPYTENNSFLILLLVLRMISHFISGV